MYIRLWSFHHGTPAKITPVSYSPFFIFEQMAKSGLPFYGFPPFQNSLPLGHPDNAPAVAWLMGELPGIGASDATDATGDTGVAGASGERSRYAVNDSADEIEVMHNAFRRTTHCASTQQSYRCLAGS